MKLTFDHRWWLEHGIERDGKICEIRADHHGDRKNPQRDLLGFDHAERGYTTLDDRSSPSPS